MRNWLYMNQPTLVLARGELVSFRLMGRQCRVSCVAGRVWATASGRREDFVLVPGEQAVFAGRDMIVVEALRTATVRLVVTSAAPLKARVPSPLARLPAGQHAQ